MHAVVRRARFIVLAALLVSALASLNGPRAYAATGGSCDPRDPSCTVNVGGNSHGGGHGSHGSKGGRTSSTPGCHNTNPEQGCDPCPTNATPLDPSACDAYSHNLYCSQVSLAGTGASYATWVSFLKGIGCWHNPYVPGNPVVAAHDALASIHFPKPTGDRSPTTSLTYDGLPFTYVNLWTFYWTDPRTWKVLTATASDGDQSATVTARPVQLNFDPGNGARSVTCGGPGRPWTAADGNGAPTNGACAFQYARVASSPITTTQSIVWKITWRGTGNTSGEIPSLSTSTSEQLRVLQIQVVNR